MKVKINGYIVHAIQVSNRWIFTIESDDRRNGLGYVADLTYDDKNSAIEAGVKYVKSIEKSH